MPLTNVEAPAIIFAVAPRLADSEGGPSAPPEAVEVRARPASSKSTVPASADIRRAVAPPRLVAPPKTVYVASRSKRTGSEGPGMEAGCQLDATSHEPPVGSIQRWPPASTARKASA